MQTFTIPQVTTQEAVVTLVLDNGQLVEVYFTEESGKVVTRKKIDTITGVWHPGIIIGRDRFGRLWVVHNHYKHGRPRYEIYDSYLKGQEGFWDKREVHFFRRQVVERAIAEVARGKRYDKFNYNCQTFVNLIVQDANKSEAVDTLSDVAMVAGLLLMIFGAIGKNRNVLAMGAGIAGIGAGVKGYSRFR